MVTRGEREQTLEILYFSMPYLCLVSRTIKVFCSSLLRFVNYVINLNFVVIQ